MGPPTEILDLINRFREQYESYRSTSYNEAQLRREFVNPFFKALGWDVENEQGYAEAYKDVIHEDSIKIGGSTKAPDYSFRVGGVRKFFVETKKPFVNIRQDVSPAFQLRRYAWSAKLPLSILTDFEELAVYDCRVRPHKNDEPPKARILYLGYEQYAEHWHEIASIFSRQAILNGSFHKYAQSTKRKRGTAEVDDAFLSEIEGWRGELARNLALRNGKLSEREINFAVQKTVDRIIFLRICEDRGIERYGGLQSLLAGPKIYARLCELFQKADDRYNSGLFHFTKEKDRNQEPDEWTLSLAIDDRVLKDIIRGLYYPESPFEFSVLGSDILGQVYEQFLGKVIRLTKGHRAKVEDKPEVKKAGGVYYTPTYIVDYIVQQTVGKLLEGKTPHQVAARTKTWKRSKRGRPLTVLDPACGSGTFLIGAYEYLLEWYLRWYTENEPDKWLQNNQPTIYESGVRSARIHAGSAGPDECGHYKRSFRLTTAERKRILLDHIHGVDIDPQAVEITKLSLLLKVLEGENEESVERQLRLFRERALPDLAQNIKCGNSLIGPDFYEGKRLDLFDEEEMLRINAFDWQADFSEIMQSGGFDAVIGNPPYVLLQGEFRDDPQLSYFRSSYAAASYKIDTYHLFIEKGIRLGAADGRCAMITPANLLTNNYLSGLRRLMLERSAVDQILVIDGGVFAGISVDNSIFVVSPGRPSESDFCLKHVLPESQQLVDQTSRLISPDHARMTEHVLFTGTTDARQGRIWSKVSQRSKELGEIAFVNFGKQLRHRRHFTQDVIDVETLQDIPKNYRPCLTGRNVLRYRVQWANIACLNDQIARCGGCWDEGRQNAQNKLVTRQIGRYPEFAIDGRGYQCLNTIFMVNLKKCESAQLDVRYVLGVLNARLTRAFWLDQFCDRRRTFPKIKGTYLKKLPIPWLDCSNSVQAGSHQRMVGLVERMLRLHKQSAAAKTTHERTAAERQIDATDRRIDRLVYELYDLTNEEIGIVEEACCAAGHVTRR